MTYLVERLADLRRHLDHLREIRPRVIGPESLERDLTLHNDVLFSLFTVCQLVIDVASELSSRRGDRFEDYTEAGRNLGKDPRFPIELVRQLERPAVCRSGSPRGPKDTTARFTGTLNFPAPGACPPLP